MMVCHCNAMACGEIRTAVRQLRTSAEGHGVVTPGRVFSCCGKRPKCGGCMPTVARLIAETVTEPQPVRTLVTGMEVAGLAPAPSPVPMPASAAKERDAA